MAQKLIIKSKIINGLIMILIARQLLKITIGISILTNQINQREIPSIPIIPQALNWKVAVVESNKCIINKVWIKFNIEKAKAVNTTSLALWQNNQIVNIEIVGIISNIANIEN